MQQRSAEFTTLFDGFATLRPALLEPMPVAEGRARNVAAADLLAEAEDPAANVGTATKPVTAGQGGGVYVDSATLTMDSCNFHNNQAYTVRARLLLETPIHCPH